MDQTLKTLLFDSVKPNRLEEVEHLMAYIEDGSPCGEPLFLSLGETWEHTPNTLTEYLSKAPRYVHGYQLSMYGLPALRTALSAYITKDYRLPATVHQGRDFEVGVTWTGTRNAMYDYGRLLRDHYFATQPPIIITTAPGWDYPGVFEPLDYRTRYINLSKEKGFVPDLKAFKKAIMDTKGRPALLVINAQHNPTSVNWPESLVRGAIRLALEHSLALLIDDAHYGVCHPDVTPTASCKILLEELPSFPDYKAPWLVVRSLGKQYGINGWGSGVLISHPTVLDEFANSYRTQHIYNYGGPLQWALAEWLSTDEPTHFLARRSKEIADNKQLLLDAFTKKFGYPSTELFGGDCTNFLLFSVPPAYEQRKESVKSFLQDCLKRGIVLTDAWPRPYDTPIGNSDYNCVRLYAGAGSRTIEAFIKRLEEYEFRYGMDAFRPITQSA